MLGLLKKMAAQLTKLDKLSYQVLHWGLRLACLLALAALFLLIAAQGAGYAGWAYVRYARELSSQPGAVLLIAVLGSVCIEDLQRSKKSS